MQRFRCGVFSWLHALVLCAMLIAPLPLASAEQASPPNRDDFLTLARKGWVYEVRTARLRRANVAGPVQFNSTEAALGPVCVIGDRPHAQSVRILSTFADLLSQVYGQRLMMTFVGHDIRSCPPRQRIYLRFYSGAAPNAPFNTDLQYLDREFEIGFPPGWREPVRSPGQVNGFFGRRGATAHLLINQPPGDRMSDLEKTYFASILIEELFQVVSFGSDILKFDRETPFFSKLQEVPVNLRFVPWGSDRFMSGLLQSTPRALCSFDVFMLHALAGANLPNTNSSALLTYISGHFDQLRRQTLQTLANPDYAAVLDNRCLTVPG